MGRLICFVPLFCLLWMTPVQAELIQILHTNDLHGFFEHSVTDPTRGGYAALKSLIDREKQRAQARGIPTLVVDAGDFLEGSIFYMAERGLRTFQIMSELEFDAVAVGNHDWLMGSKELELLLKEYPPKFSYLAANFISTDIRHTHIRKEIEPFKIFNLRGQKIALLGLTTNEVFYEWRFNGGKITSPVRSGKRWSRKLKRKHDADYVIALTHLGLGVDKKLAADSKYIDLIVGGHSHTVLPTPVVVKNKKHQDVPIVQTGSHGVYLGRLVLDVGKGRPLRVVSYDLIPVLNSGAKDEKLDNFVAQSREILHGQYGEAWLSEVLGTAEVPLVHSVERLTPWTAFITDAIKEATQADISFHSPGFAGADLPAGPVTRENIFNSYPRVFDLDDKEGWYIWKVDIYGVVLKSLVRFILKGQQAVAFSGISFDLINRDNEEIHIDPDEMVTDNTSGNALGRFLGLDGKYRVHNMRVKGEEIKLFKKYRVALPEGIVVGGLGISDVVRYLLRKINRSEVTVWSALAEKFQREGGVRADYGRTEEKHYRPNYQKNSEYMFVPGRRWMAPRGEEAE